MSNKNVVNDSYPLHRIDDQIDSLRGSAWFTTLDLTKDYHQMNLEYWFPQIYNIYNAYRTKTVEGLAFRLLRLSVLSFSI